MRDMIAIRIANITNDNGVKTASVAEPVVMKTLTEEDYSRELPPALRVTPEDAQQFMDELWRVGIRPTEGAGSVGQLAAVSKHLEDMRTLVFNTK